MSLRCKFTFLSFFLSYVVCAQDTFKNKKTIRVNSIEIKENTIMYQAVGSSGDKVEIDPDKVQSIKYQDGRTSLISEIFLVDTLILNKGRKVPIKSFELKEYSIEYHEFKSSKKSIFN
ncbi:MAG: hypothetical protein IPQ03_15935 [Bacteroidetes bacterium]|nr:hypothetical protein [Bacteroidota bacterium]